MEFTIETTLEVGAKQIFDAWLDSDSHSQMTGGEAEISNLIGDTFTAWDGYISGENLDIKANSYIKQTWRTSEFTDEEKDSILEIFLSEKDGKTLLKLTHSNLPAHGEQYIKGWDDNYFAPMKAFFENL